MKNHRCFVLGVAVCLMASLGFGCSERRSTGEKPAVPQESDAESNAAARPADTDSMDNEQHVAQVEQFPGGVQPDEYKAQKLVNQLTNYMMAVCSENGCPKDVDSAKKGVRAQFKINWPSDPWGNDYTYKYISDSKFEITSLGKDGQPNTEDDIKASKQNR